MSAMAARTPTIDPPHLSDSVSRVLRELWKDRYVYKPPGENVLAPVSVAHDYPLLLETQDHLWLGRFLSGSLKAWSNYALKHALFLAQRAAFSFDAMRAHGQMFYCGLPEFARTYDSDEAFAYRRVAGPNAVSITRVQAWAALRKKIPLHAWAPKALEDQLGGVRIDLRLAARQGRLFEVDFRHLMECFEPARCPPTTTSSARRCAARPIASSRATRAGARNISRHR